MQTVHIPIVHRTTPHTHKTYLSYLPEPIARHMWSYIKAGVLEELIIKTEEVYRMIDDGFTIHVWKNPRYRKGWTMFNAHLVYKDLKKYSRSKNGFWFMEKQHKPTVNKD